MGFDKYFIFGFLFIIIYIIIVYMRKNNYKSIEKETLDYNNIENIFFEKVNNHHQRWWLEYRPLKEAFL